MGSELTKFESEYPALTGGGAVAAVLQENLGGEELSMFDLERIRVPSGKSALWEVTDENGEPTGVKSVEGVVIHTKLVRNYWEKSREESGSSNEPPTCSSADAITGVGAPGGPCAKCALKDFSEGEDGTRERPRCQLRRLLFLLRPGAALPSVISVPPTSLKSTKKWLFALAQRAKPYYTVVSRFDLEKAANAGGVEFARIKPSTVGDLTKEQIAAVRAFAEKTRETMASYADTTSASDEASLNAEIG